MKKTLLKITSILLLCSFGLAVSIPASNAASNAAKPKQKADPMAFARGAQTWVNNCGNCHNFRDAKDFRDDQWKIIMSHMRTRAGLTGKETRDILQFLQKSN